MSFSSSPRILPLPLRKVMQEKNEGGGGWQEMYPAGYTPAQEGVQAPLGSGARPRAAGRGSRCGVWGAGGLDEQSVALLTHEPHPQQKSSL